MTTEIVPATNGQHVMSRSEQMRAMMPQTIEQMVRFCDDIARTEFAGKLRGKPEEVFSCVMMGAEVGLTPFQSLRYIAVINGRPSMWGDAMLALCRQSPLWDGMAFKEELSGTGDDWTATCTVCRKGENPITRKFSIADAKRAKLIDRGGPTSPWATFPQRMLMFRARSFALRDAFGDVLSGLEMAEIAQDLPPLTQSVPALPAETTEAPPPTVTLVERDPETITAAEVEAITDDAIVTMLPEDVQMPVRGWLGRIAAAESAESVATIDDEIRKGAFAAKTRKFTLPTSMTKIFRCRLNAAKERLKGKEKPAEKPTEKKGFVFAFTDAELMLRPEPGIKTVLEQLAMSAGMEGEKALLEESAAEFHKFAKDLPSEVRDDIIDRYRQRGVSFLKPPSRTDF